MNWFGTNRVTENATIRQRAKIFIIMIITIIIIV